MESLGAKFVELALETGASEDRGGYAKALAEARRTAANGQPVLINVHIGRTRFRDGSISM